MPCLAHPCLRTDVIRQGQARIPSSYAHPYEGLRTTFSTRAYVHGSTVHTCMRARRDRAFVKDRTYARHTTIRHAYDTECLPLAINELVVDGIRCHSTIDHTACVPPARRNRAFARTDHTLAIRPYGVRTIRSAFPLRSTSS